MAAHVGFSRLKILSDKLREFVLICGEVARVASEIKTKQYEIRKFLSNLCLQSKTGGPDSLCWPKKLRETMACSQADVFCTIVYQENVKSTIFMA